MDNYSIHPDADAEYRAEIVWYLDRDPAAARRFVEAFDRAVASIRQYPEMFARYDDAHRFVTLGRYPHTLVYRTDGTNVRVVAVAHTKRKPGYWVGRE